MSGRKLRDLDLHRPAVDAVTFQHEGREYRRVPEVIDCWFDSGAMPYAQWHYPFENEAAFEKSFPADFICEAIDQTRGWFYTLHAISTMVEDSVAYKNVVCLSHIVDADGKKMSKSQGNVINPYDVFDSVGADAMRWHFTARVAPDVQKRVSVEIIADVASSFINTFWNTYAFFVMYARLDGFDGTRDVAAREPARDRPLDHRAARADDRDRHGGARRLRRADGRRRDRALRRPAQQLVRAPQPAPLLEGRERRRQAVGVPHALRVPRRREPVDGAVRAVHHREGPSESRAGRSRRRAGQRPHGELAGATMLRASTAR